MDYRILPAGNKIPEEVYAIVEIPKGEGRIRYEYRTNGLIVIERLRGKDRPMFPGHYCGIPATLSLDGDPLDLLILGDEKLKTGDVVAVRPVAVMNDKKKGIDPKIIGVLADSVTDEYRHIQTLADIPEADREEIQKWWSRSHEWEDLPVAHQIICESVERWNKTAIKGVGVN